MNKYLLLLFAFVGTFIISNAQQCENLVLNDVQMQCSDSDVTLVPSFLNASYKSTRAYTVGGEAPCPIPVYDQEGFTGIESDDDWQGPFQLGFNFCFFENQYDRIMVSDNGKVTFDLELEPEQFDPWDVEDGYALPTQNIQTNVILGPFMDNLTTGNNNPNPGNSISFGILNQTMPGQRIFGVEYNTPQFSCTTTNTRSRILLYESSNVIDVVIMEKPICTGWSDGNAMVGIQNKSGTIGYQPAGRINGAWLPTLIPGEEERGELWRFIPNGPDSSEYAFAWFKEDENGVYQFYSGDENITISPQEQENYRVDITVTGGSCSSSDEAFTLSTEATVTPGFTPDVQTPINLVECENPVGSALFDFDINQTGFVLDGLTLTDFNIIYHDSFASAQDGTIGIIDETVQYNSAGNETIYIRVEDAADATCYTIRSFTLTVLPTDDSTISYNTNAYCLSEMNPLPDNIVTLGGIFTISNGGTIDSATGELDLTASALGTDNTGIFTITYTTTGTCFSSTDFIITLTNDANATFVYPINACLTGTNPIPTSITNTGGTFTVDNGAMIDAVTGELDLSSTTEGQSYIITHTFTGICPGQETQTIMIIGDDDSSFTYPLAIYCNDGTNPLPTATTSGGLYSISNGGIIDNTTGEVNLSGSALGTDNSGNFTVTYTTTGDCPTSSTFNLTIEITNDASFTLENQVCISGSNPSPLTITTVGGIFTVDNGATIDSATGELDLTSTTAGTTYAITYTFGGNCPSNSSQSISVIGDDDSSFTYPMNIYCNDGTDPIATATVVTNAGTYAINNGGVINIANGEIDLDASALGTDNSGNFTITYTTTGDCPTSSTFNITIELTKDASFDFANEICLADPNPSASNIASTGGTFSVDNGASINATTGELDLSTTMEGTVYTVTYTFTGNCPSDTSNTITIIEVPSISAPTTTLTSCDNGNGSANFDISIVEDEILGMTTGVDVTYHPTSLDANNATNEMSTNPELVAFGNIWIRVENSNGCFSTVEIPLIIEQCFLVIPQGFSPNSDITENQTFSINHLRTKYPDFKLYVYNRFGNEVFYGSASKDDWNGEKDNDGEELPAGTYFYGLELNDDLKTYHKGWVYLQR